MRAKVRKIVDKLESTGLSVVYDDSDENNPHIEIYRDETKKKPLLEIVFDKKGNAEHLVISKRLDNACWLDVKGDIKVRAPKRKK